MMWSCTCPVPIRLQEPVMVPDSLVATLKPVSPKRAVVGMLILADQVLLSELLFKRMYSVESKMLLWL